MTWHAASFTTSYITNPNAGDHTADVGERAFLHPTTSWFFVNGLEVQRRPAATVVAFGDSITDGFFSTINGNDRWPDVLQRRLLRDRDHRPVISVVNQGIAGNMITRVGACRVAARRATDRPRLTDSTATCSASRACAWSSSSWASTTSAVVAPRLRRSSTA
jgi:hypothetical protein